MKAILDVFCCWRCSSLWETLVDGGGLEVGNVDSAGRVEAWTEEGGGAWLNGPFPFRRSRRDLTLMLWALWWRATLPTGPVLVLLKVCSALETQTHNHSETTHYIMEDNMQKQSQKWIKAAASFVHFSPSSPPKNSQMGLQMHFYSVVIRSLSSGAGPPLHHLHSGYCIAEEGCQWG